MSATLAQNIDGIVVCELRRGFALGIVVKLSHVMSIMYKVLKENCFIYYNCDFC